VFRQKKLNTLTCVQEYGTTFSVFVDTGTCSHVINVNTLKALRKYSKSDLQSDFLVWIKRDIQLSAKSGLHWSFVKTCQRPMPQSKPWKICTPQEALFFLGLNDMIFHEAGVLPQMGSKQKYEFIPSLDRPAVLLSGYQYHPSPLAVTHSEQLHTVVKRSLQDSSTTTHMKTRKSCTTFFSWYPWWSKYSNFT